MLRKSAFLCESIIINGYFIKGGFTSGISDIKIVQKSGNPKEEVLYFGGSGIRCIPAYSE